MTEKLNQNQLDYVEGCALAVIAGVARSRENPQAAAEYAFDMAHAMLAEREKRHGKIPGREFD